MPNRTASRAFVIAVVVSIVEPEGAMDLTLSRPAMEPNRKEATGAEHLPERVRALITAQEIESERLIGWVQLGIAGLFATLYFIAPRPSDAPSSMLSPVPPTLAIYTAFTAIRLWLSYYRELPRWLLVVSILSDTALLLGLIWWFHLQYEQPPAFSLKVPTFIYIIVFVALRALRFDWRYVSTAGLAAVTGWCALVAAAVGSSPPGTVTRSFTAYINGNAILIGAELDKIVAILVATAVLALTVRRAQRTLVTAVREETAGREIRRFLSGGVADVITRSETVVEAGNAVERVAAVLMLDIRGFTRFSSTVAPIDVVRVLTGFHARVVPLIQRNGGVVDKFLGDGVMATFGAIAPSSTAAADALRALDAIMDAVEDWRAQLPDQGVSTDLVVNGAVACGRLVFAALGNEDRLEYTVIGDAANLAAKLEKQNKIEGSRALVPAATYDLAAAQGFTPSRRPAWRRFVHVVGTAEAIELIAI